jgi:uncharacterized protein (TIGR03000 family)
VPSTGTYGSYVQQPTNPNIADFTVRVPDANAQVFFDNYLTHESGTVRQFESGNLTPGQTYTFHIRAVWNQNGQPVQATRDVQAASGQHVMVDFDNAQHQP